MPIFDFKEIPSANPRNNSANADSFEQFALSFMRCFFHKNIEVNDEISRGADNGKDFIIEEIRQGFLGKTKVRWLVSCKHFAHRNKPNSVSSQDEENLHNRIKSNNCSGFIGFYSTVISPTLKNMLDSLRADSIEVYIFDSEEIERRLLLELRQINHQLDAVGILDLANRFFPESMKRWNDINFKAPINLVCDYCSSRNLHNDDLFGNLMHNEKRIDRIVEVGILHFTPTIFHDFNVEIDSIEKVYFFHEACLEKFIENNIKENYIENKRIIFNKPLHNKILSDKSINEYIVPDKYWNRLEEFILNRNKYSSDAFLSKLNLFKQIFPWISREYSAQELVEKGYEKFMKEHLLIMDE